ncbi:MAG: PQQ-binding-like beta-propeller repeat protein [Bacteroidota bacterium]
MELLWKFKNGGRIFSSATSGNGLIYFGSDDNMVYALDENSGKQAWSYRTGAAVNSSPLFVNEKLFVLSNDGYFYALDGKTGKLLWRFRTKGEKKKDMWTIIFLTR